MSQPPDEYDLKPQPTPPEPPGLPPDFVPPVPIIEGPDEEESPAEIDAREHRALAMVGYVLFPLPLLLAPQSRFAHYHGLQGLTLFLVWVALFIMWMVLSLVYYCLPTISALAIPLWLFWNMIWLLLFGCFFGLVYLIVQGILHAADGKIEPLPVIGKIQLLPPDPPSAPNPPPGGGAS